ncbi:MAG: hypothetical protein LH480_07805 [Rubrivivax sp.]|nr:hypothetical protein [Rubrivivax sp.]
MINPICDLAGLPAPTRVTAARVQGAALIIGAEGAALIIGADGAAAVPAATV